MQFSRFLAQSITPALPPYGAHDPQASARAAVPANAVTPYLGLRSRLSQVWINRWTILLLLILARLLISVASLNSDMASAKREALSACTSVESMGSTMASMPHYMSKGVNELTASGIENAVKALKSMLLLTMTGVEEIIVFYINVLTQTYLCLITLVVTGAMKIAVDVLEKATEFLNKALKEVGEGIEKGVEGFENALNGFLGAVNDVTSIFGGDTRERPKIDITDDIKKLSDLKLPDSITEGINKLNASIPTFEDVNNFTNAALRFPFKEVRKLVNESLGVYKFDRDAFPVPQKEKLSFCSENDGINTFFNNLAKFISTAKTIFMVILIIAAIGVCIPMAWREIRSWRAMKERSLLVRKDANDPMDVVYIVSRPYTSTAGLKVSNWFRPGRKQVLVRWIVAYATSAPALFVLSLGLAGLFSCLCQYILLQAVKKEVPKLTNQVSQFADKVVKSLTNASEQWAVSSNRVIDDTNNDINNKVFGWVNTTTGGINNTLNVFVDKTNEVLNITFGGTILYEPAKEVINCLILLKVQGIQKALTWASDNAHITFPRMNKDTFSLGAAESIGGDGSSESESFLANPGDKTQDAISAAVLRVTKSLENGIRVEALISTVVVCIWVFILLCAIVRACMLTYRRDKNRGEGGNDPNPMVIAPTGPDGEGFNNIPLGPVHGNRGFGTDADVVPQYSTNPNAYSAGHRGTPDSEFEYEQKLGFAGHRNDAAVQSDHTRSSSYGQLDYGSDIKRG
ncbi:hypothetical protein AJ80_00958 [Polytolypa hystricis UAMH7299]|uniref:Plasma membrane fusion protein PRM1 n=1 Tax=Polytolypa hystricis (strain UAMH7299) TaxID=1447883 RepID=A0A2B7Z295_POLH7|nr:hypothetical protein AJ80_00958 [Polytolypa hystricis UAMH7299]